MYSSTVNFSLCSTGKNITNKRLPSDTGDRFHVRSSGYLIQRACMAEKQKM